MSATKTLGSRLGLAMSSTSHFARLLELAKAPTSEKRRELLREITDLFFLSPPARSDGEGEAALFDDVLRTVAREMHEGVLVELAERFADAAYAPPGLLRDLAADALPIAAPILSRSPLLSDDDLLAVMRAASPGHANAVAARASVSEKVSDFIVSHGDDATLDTLVRNEGARLSRGTFETVVDRARANKALHEGVVARQDLPLDLLNEMYFTVEKRLRAAILERNASVDPAALDAALAKTRSRLQRTSLTSTEERRRAERFVGLKKAAGELTPGLLISLYRDKQFNHFLCGLAELTDLEHDTARQIIQARDIDALAMVCRAADIERPLFVTIAVLTCGGEGAISRAEEFGRIYMSVPIEAAQRAMRFFKVRKSAGERAAA